MMIGTETAHKGEMQPFVKALTPLYVTTMESFHLAEDSFQQVVPGYLAKTTFWVLDGMAGVRPTGVEQTISLPESFVDSISATVGFAGFYSGTVSIHCPIPLAGILAARMIGLDSAEEYGVVSDAMGELVNVLVGEIKLALSADGLDIQLSMPSVVSGSQYQLTASNNQHTATITFMLEGYPVYVSLMAEQNRLLRAAAEELRHKREWLALALEGGRLGLWDWDLQTGKAHYSNEWAAMLGYEAENLIQEVTTWESLVHPDDLPKVRLALQEHLSGCSPHYEAEHRLLTRRGVWSWILTRGKIVEYLDDGTPRLIAGTHLDITRRKEAEQALNESRQQLQQLNEQLEARVLDEVAKNREKDLRLLQQDKLASIGQLAAGVAHEINNPMGFITSNLSCLADYTNTLLNYFSAVEQIASADIPEEIRLQLLSARKEFDLDYILGDLQPLLEESREGAERVRRIVLDLKEFAHPDEAEMIQADLNNLIEKTIRIVQNELKYVARLELRLGELPSVRCHPQQISQVISNLLINAAHAIEHQQGIITIVTEQKGQHLYLTVSDNGKGIPPELCNRIFDPFFTTKEIGKGTGLGLSISYDIIEKHNGEISVTSTTGVGTTFQVKLPVMVN